MSRKILLAKSVDLRPALISMFAALVSAAMLLVVSSCGNDEEWNDMPPAIASFVSKYFPGEGINSYTHNGATYHVRVDDGPGITFGSDYAWEAVDGYGMPLPQVMLFDQLPPKLYAYLQDSGQLDSVFSMERDSSRYTLTLLNSTLVYDIESGQISGGTPAKAGAGGV